VSPLKCVIFDTIKNLVWTERLCVRSPVRAHVDHDDCQWTRCRSAAEEKYIVDNECQKAGKRSR